MSRIGKRPISIPDKVKVDLQDHSLKVEGPKGKVSKAFAEVVKLSTNEKKQIVVTPLEETRFARAMYGTARSIIAGMVKGASVGFVKELEIQGVGFKAVLKGREIEFSLGYSHQILFKIPEGVNVAVTDGTRLRVEGADKQLVGAVAAEIRGYYPPEPYKGKGVRIVGERVRRKEGKTVA